MILKQRNKCIYDYRFTRGIQMKFTIENELVTHRGFEKIILRNMRYKYCFYYVVNRVLGKTRFKKN